ncbi:MAG: hypothetical protein IJZ68_05955 [Bacteroidaceae bacterium]|nr:hypothetical protein [Bacteroidaceae bacterium]
MKKVLALLLCLVMVFSLAACGGNEKPDETKKPDSSVTDPVDDEKEPTIDAGDSDGENDEGKEDVIRPNGELPNNERDLTEAEVRHYVGVIVNAALKLDIETLKEYAKNEEDLEGYQRILDDPTTKEWFMKTIGTSVYLESTGEIVYPECEAVFNMWYTDMWLNGETPPEDVTKLSVDELTAIYDKYKDKIPYVMEEVNPEYDCEIYLSEGKIYFDLKDLLGVTSYCYDIDDLAPTKWSFESPTQHIAAYVFGYDIDEIDPTFEDALEDGDYSYLMPLMKKDLSLLPAYMATIKDQHDWDATPGKDDWYEKYYQAYIKDEAMRAKVQDWMEDNMVCGFHSYGFDMWYTADVDKYFMYEDLPADEKELLKDLWVCEWTFETADSKPEHVFAPYYELVDMMVECGVIKDIFD